MFGLPWKQRNKQQNHKHFFQAMLTSSQGKFGLRLPSLGMSKKAVDTNILLGLNQLQSTN